MTKKGNLSFMQRDRLQRGLDPTATATSMQGGTGYSALPHTTFVKEETTQMAQGAINEPQSPDNPMTYHNRNTPERSANPTQLTTVSGPAPAPDGNFMQSGYEYAKKRRQQ